MIRRALLALFAVLLLWSAGFAVFLWRIETAVQTPEPAEAAVVFTGGGERVLAGLRLLQQHRVNWLLISGVGHAATLRELATAAGFDPTALPPLATHITLGRAATSTHGNAQETADWVAQTGVHSLILVTAYFHIPRALAELRSHVPGLRLLAFPVRSPAPHEQMIAWRFLIGEYNKYLAVAAGLDVLAARLGIVLSEHAS